MNKDWVLQTRETRRSFANSTWVPLRASQDDEQDKAKVTQIGYISEFFGCGSVAFPPQHREVAEKLGWSDLGISHSARPYAYKDGYYSPIDQYQYNDKEPIGVELVFVHDQPVVGGTRWILNPDLVVALHLVKEGNNWVRPEEDFVVVAREVLDSEGKHQLIEIKREFLIDYLAARNLALRLSYYRQRVENVATIEGTEYAGWRAIRTIEMAVALNSLFEASMTSTAELGRRSACGELMSMKTRMLLFLAQRGTTTQSPRSQRASELVRTESALKASSGRMSGSSTEALACGSVVIRIKLCRTSSSRLMERGLRLRRLTLRILDAGFGFAQAS